MKITYIDTSVGGHHIPYLTSLMQNVRYDCSVILPDKIEEIEASQYIYNTKENEHRDFFSFYRWCKEIKTVIDREQPDIIHFLYGDIFYRFFGIGLELFNKYKVVLTLHWVKESKIGMLSTKCIATKVDEVVVHSYYLKKILNRNDIVNVKHIEYPQFNKVDVKIEDAKKYWELKDNIPVVACVGNTRHDKGLDFLLDALKYVKKPFQLLIAGKEDFFDKEYIMKNIAEYSENVHVYLNYLTDEELAMAFEVADFIVLPYRRRFNGASGPLGEGVCRNKCIIGANHGNLGYTIEKNDLGYTFEAENSMDLANTLNNVLSNRFCISEKYKLYQESLNLKYFTESYQALYIMLIEKKKL